MSALPAVLLLATQCHEPSRHEAEQPPKNEAQLVADGWPTKGQFSFERPLPPDLDLTVDTRDSPLVAELGDVYHSAPSQGVVAPFALGMTSDQVEAVLARNFPGQGAARAGLAKEGCRERHNDARGPQYRLIPVGVTLPFKPGNPQLNYLSFVDDGGIARVSEIGVSIDPHDKGAAALLARLGALLRIRGSGPSGVIGKEMSCDAQPENCQKAEQPLKPDGVLLHESPERTVFFLSIGKLAQRKAADLALRQTVFGEKGDCSALLNRRTELAYNAYLRSLTQDWAPAGQAIYNWSTLPQSFRSAWPNSRERPLAIRPLGSGFIFEYTFIAGTDPSFQMGRGLEIWQPGSDGIFRAVRQWTDQGEDTTAPGTVLSQDELKLVTRIQQDKK
ncbi:hypothetical protein [Novosphingobium terrae]|uniref:hypothetical protein n=1 Tax=Novosphingobium terrae TaxID=2726189 RepID=UPI00197E29F6|nr:hypothetical protein [Novosphingobium terrae]